MSHRPGCPCNSSHYATCECAAIDQRAHTEALNAHTEAMKFNEAEQSTIAQLRSDLETAHAKLEKYEFDEAKEREEEQGTFFKEIDAVDASNCADDADHETYKLALKLVGERHSKYALVSLVNWGLHFRKQLEAARKRCAELEARLGEAIHDWRDDLVRTDDDEMERGKDLAALRALVVKKDEALRNFFGNRRQLEGEAAFLATPEFEASAREALALTPSSLRDHVCVPRGEWERAYVYAARIDKELDGLRIVADELACALNLNKGNDA